MISAELRLALGLALVAALLLVVGMVSLHEKHYQRRRLTLLESDVKTIRSLLTEDRTL